MKEYQVWHMHPEFAIRRHADGEFPMPSFPDQYTMVGHVNATSLEAALAGINDSERAFSENRHPSDSHRVARVTSVGDVLVGEEGVHRIGRTGFERLNPDMFGLRAEACSGSDTLRDLFDKTVTTSFAEAALRDPSQFIHQTLEDSRERYIEQAEAGWPAFRDEVAGYPAGRAERLLERFDAYESSFNPHIVGADVPLRQLTDELIECCQLDHWPGRAAVVDFGLDSSSHLGALQFAVREELVSPQELDAAMGHGQWLTAIAQRGGENPYRNVTFRTAWDEIRVAEAAYPEYAEPVARRPAISCEDPPRPTQKPKPLTM